MSETFDSATGGSPVASRSSQWLFAVLLGITLAISWSARCRVLAEWYAQPEAHFSQGVPASGSDSYYWFRVAREIRERGADLGDRDPLRAWPEGLERGPTPAFSWLMASASAAFGGDVYLAGIALSLFLSSLFILPLGLYARAIDYPLAGLLGGFFGGLGRAYVERSSVDRVDTDGGTLFFMCLLALAIGSLRSTATPRRNAIAAALAGLSLAAFCRWYGQPWFWFVYVGTLGLHLAFGGFAWRQAVLLGLLFVVCANPLSALPGLAGLVHFLQFYVMPSTESVPGPFDYASVTRDISELLPLPLSGTLARVVDVQWVSALGLLGFLAFSVLRWRAAVPLLPIALLGLYALHGPQRFGMYLAPLVGFGWGFILHTLAATWKRFAESGRRLADPVAFLAAIAGAALLLGHTAFALDPKPSVPVGLIASLQRLAPKLPPRAAVLASWGRGYLIADVAGTATLNDGEAPDPLVHYLFARAISSSDPLELRRIVEVLSTFGRSDLHALLDDSRDPQTAIDALLRREASTAGNVVLVLTGLDLLPFPAFFRTGHWSFSDETGPEDGFLTFDCKQVGKRHLRCSNGGEGGIDVDLGNGRMSAGGWLRRVVEIRDGRVVRETEHAPGSFFSLELIPRETAGTFTAHLVSELVFQSNFNQLYLLGRFDPALFEEIHRDPSVMRAYRIRATDHSHEAAPGSPAAYHRRVRPRHGPGMERP